MKWSFFDQKSSKAVKYGPFSPKNHFWSEMNFFAGDMLDAFA